MTYVSTLSNMEKKGKKFQLRLKDHEREALHKLADRDGISAASYLLNYIRREAKEKGIPI